MAVNLPKAPNLPIAPLEYTQQYLNNLANALRLYFNQVDNFALALSTPAYGTKTNRPTTNLIIGQFYFDQTLGYPVWWNGKAWVNASGTTV
jgi:hypothetical protein